MEELRSVPVLTCMENPTIPIIASKWKLIPIPHLKESENSIIDIDRDKNKSMLALVEQAVFPVFVSFKIIIMMMMITNNYYL